MLDTHVFLWAIISPKELSTTAKLIIENSENEICVSAISLWEISIKVRIGKLSLEGIMVDELLGFIGKMDFKTLDMTPEDSIGYVSLKEKTHKDPFDRMLITQSISRKLTLISKDSELKKFVPYGLKLVWE